MTLDKTWFTEIHADAGSAFSLKLNEKLHSEKSPYQTIDIYSTETYGNLMVLDGCYMVTDRDNAIYHEMMSHPALFTHKNAQRVAIIGGGDCGTVKEVLKHASVREAVLVEIDERVTLLSKKYFPTLTQCLTDPRAKVLHEDGVKWMKTARNYDVIMVDSTDPIGPATELFSEGFYRDCYAALNDGGILVQQSESPLLHMDIIIPMRQSLLHVGFNSVHTVQFFQSCYPSGWWSCTLAAKGSFDLTQFDEARVRARTFDTFYYNEEMHRASLAEPAFFKKELKAAGA